MTSASARGRRRDEPRHVRRPVLQVAVHQQDVGEAAAAHGVQAAPHGDALAAVAWMPHHLGAGGRRRGGRVVGRSVVDDDHRVDVRPRPEHHLADVRALVERRDHRDDAQRLGRGHRRGFEEERRQDEQRRGAERDDRDRRDEPEEAQRRVGRRDERPEAEERRQRRHQDHRAEVRHRVGAVAVRAVRAAVHEMDAVVDADADEGHDREHAEQVEADAGDRQHAGGPRQRERGRDEGQQREVQRRNAATSSTSTISDPAEMPLANSGVKRSAISRLTAGSPDSRAVPPDAATARRTPSTAAGEAG